MPKSNLNLKRWKTLPHHQQLLHTVAVRLMDPAAASMLRLFMINILWFIMFRNQHVALFLNIWVKLTPNSTNSSITKSSPRQSYNLGANNEIFKQTLWKIHLRSYFLNKNSCHKSLIFLSQAFWSGTYKSSFQSVYNVGDFFRVSIHY